MTAVCPITPSPRPIGGVGPVGTAVAGATVRSGAGVGAVIIGKIPMGPGGALPMCGAGAF